MNKLEANIRSYDYEKKSEYGLLKMYKNDLKYENSKLLSKKEEAELFYKYRENHDKEAYNKLIYCNTRLVINIAKRYAKFNTDFLDLVQDGNIGLMKAIDMFEPLKGFKFSTYATYWIKLYIENGIYDNVRSIHLPISVFLETIKFKKYALMYESQELSCSKKEYIMNNMNISELKYELLLACSLEITSLNETNNNLEDNNIEYINMIADDEELIEDVVLDKMEREDRINALRNAMDSVLKEKEKIVIQMRMGIYPYKKCYSLQEIGNVYGLTRERIRVIEMGAMKKLKNALIDEESKKNFNRVL